MTPDEKPDFLNVEFIDELSPSDLALASHDDEPLDAIVNTLDLLCRNAPVALSALHFAGTMEYGYFNSHIDASAWVRRLPRVKAVYVVMNPFTKTSTGPGIAAMDITRRRWLLIDCDPVREKKSNATDRELSLARDVAVKIRSHLTSLGWPEPVQADSGNGAHLPYAIDLPNDATATTLVNNVLKYLARFNTPGVTVDQTTGDPNQITKLYGTVARKGPETNERPHRLSALTHVPTPVNVVPRELLEQLVEEAPKGEQPKSSGAHLYDLKAILAKLTIYSGPVQRSGYVEYQIRCPWDSEHSDPGAKHGTIFTWSNGSAPGFTCPHDSCTRAGRDWAVFRGHLGLKTKDLILKPDAPMPSAEAFVARRYTVDDIVALVHQAGVFYAYEPEAGAYYERDEPAVRADLYKFLESAKQWANHGTKAHPELKLVPFDPNKTKVENVLDALRGISNLPKSKLPPCWLKARRGCDPRDMLAFSNGLLHIPTRQLFPSTPQFFTLNGLDFPYDPRAPRPVEWLAFLKLLWKDDTESIDALQELFGYVLTPDTKQQKIAMIVGPKRSGKGLIGRILRRLVGERNACGPTLAGFEVPFGKQVLISKTLAVISDARISGRTDTAKVAETLLAVSGEDAVTISRKYLEDWTGTLYVRFLILTNELPHVGDASGALASRFIVWLLTESFYGREDLGLFTRLVPELPGILNWALEGRSRLNERGYFVQPKSAEELVQEFIELGSPEATFLRQCTRVKPGATVGQKALFATWETWCTQNGRDKPGSSQTFARNVRAVLPWVTTRRLGGRGEQERCWEGLELLESDEPM